MLMKSWLDRFMRGYLPAYVNGTLGPIRRWIIDRGLARDATLRAELNQLSGLRSILQDQPLSIPNPSVYSRIKSETASANMLPRTAWRPSLVWPVIVALLAVSAMLLWRALPPGLEISWSLEGATPESFRVYRAPVNSSPGAGFSLIGELPAQSGVDSYGYTDLRLVPGQQFKYQVEAIDGSGYTVTSQALTGNSLEAFPRQLLFISIFVVIGFAIARMFRQLRPVILAPGQFAF